ncbi:uncharacterized protein LOC114796157 [Denticeps clupeoides]|uniref:Uncharacterized protein n=1 Tax=Denticeps clupeoides TaxID=299321 RepID=A0AAY4EU30_9TELE|nr:uncharacterized protein LOC114796157 [Denticeps clupeoides]XP_028845948.1 uncharacterized protein LOC114796157 [Denticeps clupeoides]
MSNQIVQTTRKLTTAAEMREVTKTMMQPYANWEEYLTPAPLSIAILGELVFISSSADFSISKKPERGVFKYLNHPESFRACLMQVCNSGWHAFNQAHKNMDQIRIHTGSVPDYMKEAVRILFNGSDNIIKTLLPNQLKNIRTIADQCVTLAEGVENKYLDVINLISELLEASISAGHLYGKELEKVKEKLEEAKLKEKSAIKANEQSKKALDAMSKQLEEAQDAYKASMNSVPSGWDLLGMDVVQGLAAGITGTVSGCLTAMSSPLKLIGIKGVVDGFELIKIFSKSEEILACAANFKGFVNESGINWKELYDQEKKEPKTNWTKSQFERICKDLKKSSNCSEREKVLSLCEQGIKICEMLAKYKPDQTLDKETTEQLIKEMLKLNDDAFTFDSASKGKLGCPPLQPTPPMMSNVEENSSGRKTASQVATENARFKIEQSQQQLQQIRQLYEKRLEDMKTNEKELTDVLIEMQNCKIKEIDFDKTIKMLVKGLDAMGRVKEQWKKMVLFFQMVSNIVKASLSTTLNNFVTTCDDTSKLLYNEKLFSKDNLYKLAFEASNIASLVHMISGTYTEVSSKYLMDRVSSLGRLMAMDKSKDEFHQERLKLQDSCKEAQEGIFQLVMENKKEFERKSDARMLKMDSELKAILPAAPPQETERIREIVQAGFALCENDYN